MSLQDDIKGLIHKPGVNPQDWNKVHKNLLVILQYVIVHCKAHKLPLVISSIIRPKIKGASRTNIHADGRAFDISVKGWSREDIDFLVDSINAKLNIGAISIIDHQEREAVYEPSEFKWIDGKRVQTKWEHIHFQCAPKKLR